LPPLAGLVARPRLGLTARLPGTAFILERSVPDVAGIAETMADMAGASTELASD
jgi:hypothetical protein